MADDNKDAAKGAAPAGAAPAAGAAPDAAAAQAARDASVKQGAGTAATAPGPQADATARPGAPKRAASASQADGRGNGPLTQLEAARASGATASGSQTLLNPDPELRESLTTDVLTQKREAMAAEVAESDEPAPALDELLQAHDAVVSAQKEVDEAIVKRDLARDAYDRVAEQQRTGMAGYDPNQSYVAAAKRQRAADAARASRVSQALAAVK